MNSSKNMQGRTKGAHRPRVQHTQDGLTCSGLRATDYQGQDVVEQCRLALDQGAELLAEHGLDMRDVTHFACTIADREGLMSCLPVFRQFFPTTSPSMSFMWLKDSGRTRGPAITCSLSVQQVDDMESAVA
jgi:enamine deaminase RidA (YjgF/YER057c/UK114 family)